jgi:hypothetical protein
MLVSAEAKELVDWQTLLANIISAADDSSHANINTDLLFHWQDNPSMPL